MSRFNEIQRLLCSTDRGVARLLCLIVHMLIPSLIPTLILTLAFAGCGSVGLSRNEGGSNLPQGRLAVDSVALEVGVLQLDDSQVSQFEEYWMTLDQQKLPLSQRKLLDRNGLRVGLMPSQPPAIFNQLCEPRPVELEVLNQVEQQMAAQGRLDPQSRLVEHQRIVRRANDAYRIETSEIFPEYQWSVMTDRDTINGADTHVQGAFEVLVFPQGDTSVRLRLTPRINQGEVQNMIDADAGGFAFDRKQLGQRINQLTFEVVLRPGETVLIAPTSDLQDLGKLLFGVAESAPEDSGQTPSHLTHRVLMIRLLQSQWDDLFDNRKSQTPLTSVY